MSVLIMMGKWWQEWNKLTHGISLLASLLAVLMLRLPSLEWLLQTFTVFGLVFDLLRFLEYVPLQPPQASHLHNVAVHGPPVAPQAHDGVNDDGDPSDASSVINDAGLRRRRAHGASSAGQRRSLLEETAKSDSSDAVPAAIMLATEHTDERTRSVLEEVAKSNKPAAQWALGEVATQWPDDSRKRDLLSQVAHGDQPDSQWAVSEIATQYKDPASYSELAELTESDAAAANQAVIELSTQFKDDEKTRPMMEHLARSDKPAAHQAVNELVTEWPDQQTYSLLEDIAQSSAPTAHQAAVKLATQRRERNTKAEGSALHQGDVHQSEKSSTEDRQTSQSPQEPRLDVVIGHSACGDEKRAAGATDARAESPDHD